MIERIVQFGDDDRTLLIVRRPGLVIAAYGTGEAINASGRLERWDDWSEQRLAPEPTQSMICSQLCWVMDEPLDYTKGRSFHCDPVNGPAGSKEEAVRRLTSPIGTMFVTVGGDIGPVAREPRDPFSFSILSGNRRQ